MPSNETLLLRLICVTMHKKAVTERPKKSDFSIYKKFPPTEIPGTEGLGGSVLDYDIDTSAATFKCSD